MNEVIIPKILLEKRQYQKLARRAHKVRNIDDMFLQYIAETQRQYQEFSKSTISSCEEFQDQLIKSNFYSSTKSQQMHKLVKNVKAVAVSVDENAQLNSIGLRGVKYDQPDRLQAAFEGRLESFMGTLKHYESFSDNMAIQYNIYKNKCMFLREGMEKFKELRDPVVFYNPVKNSSYAQELETRFRTATEKQISVKQEFQNTKHRKTELQASMEALKVAQIQVIKYHATHVRDLIRVLFDPDKAERVTKKDTQHMGAEEYGPSEEDRLRELYYDRGEAVHQHPENGFLDESQFTNPFPAQDMHTSNIKLHEKFYLSRCENFIRLKRNSMEDLLSFRKKLRSFLIGLVEAINQHSKKFLQIRQTAFGKNNIDKFKKDFRKFYGPNMSDILRLAIIVLDGQNEALTRLGKAINLRMEKIDLSLKEQDIDFEMFTKEFSQMFEQHKKIKIDVESQQSISSQQYKTYTRSIQSSFSHLRKTVDKINQKEAQYAQFFSKQMESILSVLLKQSFRKSTQVRIEANSELYEKFTSLNIDSEMKGLLDEDSRYEVMFHPFFATQSSNQFRSLVDFAGYQKIKKLTDRNRQERGTIDREVGKSAVRSVVGCCGLARSSSQNIRSSPFNDQFKATLLYRDNTALSGKIIAKDSGLIFQAKPTTVFKSPMRLLIPKSDIVKVSSDSSLHVGAQKQPINSSSCVCLETLLGEIVFNAVDQREDLIKFSKIKYQQKNTELQNLIDVLYWKGAQPFENSRDSSGWVNKDKSFVPRQSSNDFKDRSLPVHSFLGVPRESILIGRDSSRVVSRRKDIDTVPTTVVSPSASTTLDKQISNLAINWVENTHFFQDMGLNVVSSKREPTGSIRTNYKGMIYNMPILLRELRQCSHKANVLNIQYKWKVSFPNVSQQIPSFTVGQRVRVETSLEDPNQLTQTVILSKGSGELESTLHTQFLEYLRVMNLNLNQFISQQMSRPCDWIVEQEREQTPAQGQNQNNLLGFLSTNGFNQRNKMMDQIVNSNGFIEQRMSSQRRGDETQPAVMATPQTIPIPSLLVPENNYGKAKVGTEAMKLSINSNASNKTAEPNTIPEEEVQKGAGKQLGASNKNNFKMVALFGIIALLLASLLSKL